MARRSSSAGRRKIAFGDVLATPPPGGFLQATAAGEQALADGAAAALEGARRVADLFCGAGAFALRLARRREVFAVDSDAAAVAALQRAAGAATGLRAVHAETRDLFRRPLVGAELARFDAVLFDPPRAGAEAQARALAASRPAARRRDLLQRRQLRPRRAHPHRRRLRDRAGRAA